MLYFIQCKSIANWQNLHCFYNILVKYTTVVFGIFSLCISGMKLSTCDVTSCNDLTRWVGAPEGCRQHGRRRHCAPIWKCQRVQTAWPSLRSALKMPWLVLSRPLLSSYAQMGWENSPLALHGAHFRRGSIYLSLGERLPAPLSAVTIACLLMGGCGLSHECVEDGCKSTCVEFGVWKPDRTGDMVSLIHV